MKAARREPSGNAIPEGSRPAASIKPVVSRRAALIWMGCGKLWRMDRLARQMSVRLTLLHIPGLDILLNPYRK